MAHSIEQAAQIGSAIDRAQAAGRRITPTAKVMPPFLTPGRAARVRLAMSLTERDLLVRIRLWPRIDGYRIGAGASVLVEEGLETFFGQRALKGCISVAIGFELIVPDDRGVVVVDHFERPPSFGS